MNFQKSKSFLRNKGTFRYNVIRGSVELMPIAGSRYLPLTDYDFNSLWVEMKENGMSISLQDLAALLRSEFSGQYDPIVEYFNNVPHWKPSDPDYIQLLANTITVENQELWNRMLRKWILAVTACAMGRAPNELMLIFTGPQGKGKTRWFHRLIPEPLKEYCDSGTVNFQNKDAVINLSQTFLYIMDEMATFTKKNQAELKAWISRSLINVRRPYARSSEFMQRRGSFAGTTNEDTFLFDYTGSRRFLSFRPTNINPSHDVPMDWVFGQAKVLLENGYQPYLSEKEMFEIQQHNQAFEEITEEEELVQKWCRKPQAGRSEFLTATQIMNRIEAFEQIPVSRLIPEKVGRALRKLNIPNKKSGVSGYVVTFVSESRPKSRHTADEPLKSIVNRTVNDIIRN